MCQDFSYVIDINGNLYRHRTRLFNNSHRSIFASNRIFHSLDQDRNYARIEHVSSKNVNTYRRSLFHVTKDDVSCVLDEARTPEWWKNSIKIAIKYGEAARKINHQIRDLRKKQDRPQEIRIGYTKSYGLWINRDPRYSWQKNKTIRYCPNSAFVLPPSRIAKKAYKTREKFRKACLEQNISTRLADLIYSTKYDVLFGRLNKEHLEKYT